MAKILQLKIELDVIKPPIWRRLLIENSLTFKEFHEAIQKAMGWGGYHLYEFNVDGEIIAPEEEGYNLAEASLGLLKNSTEMQKMLEEQAGSGSPRLNLEEMNKLLEQERGKKKERKFNTDTEISSLINSNGQKIGYLYDFGDSWKHTITVENITEEDKAQTYPACIAGARACPPEDCGGVHGYLELMSIRKNKTHPQYKERISEWLGEGYDPERFDIDEVTEAIELELAADINEFVQKKSAKFAPLNTLLLEDDERIKEVKTFKEKETEYADLLGPIENAIAAFYSENKTVKDKDAIKAIKNIQYNLDRKLDYFQEPLEKFLLISISLAIKKRKTMNRELWLAFSYVLWCIDNRRMMNYSRAYLDWILHFFGGMELDEEEAFEKRYDMLGRQMGIEQEKIESMKGNPSSAMPSKEEDDASREESKYFALTDDEKYEYLLMCEEEPECEFDNFGQQLEKKGEFEKAEKLYKREIEFYPEAHWGGESLGKLYKKMGKFDLAEHNLENALKLALQQKEEDPDCIDDEVIDSMRKELEDAKKRQTETQ